MTNRRYEISRRTIFIDRLMNRFIMVGGLLIIAAISAIVLSVTMVMVLVAERLTGRAAGAPRRG